MYSQNPVWRTDMYIEILVLEETKLAYFYLSINNMISEIGFILFYCNIFICIILNSTFPHEKPLLPSFCKFYTFSFTWFLINDVILITLTCKGAFLW